MENKKEERAGGHGVYLLALVLLAVAVNYHTEILGLYQDDLYLWTRYANHHALGYIFQTGTSRFRPVWDFIAYLTLKLTGPHTEWLVPVNIAVNGALAGLVYGIGYRMAGRRPVAFLAGTAFLLSRFSYYQIGMVLGGMESAATALALCLLYCLYLYLNTENGLLRRRYAILAVGVYFLLVFTHERYMVLILLMAAVFAYEHDWGFTALSAGVFGLVQLIRWYAIGTVLPPGAGHTTVAETFELGRALKYAFSQVFYLFGISAGPDYLSGKPWSESSALILVLVVFSIGALAGTCVLFAAVLLRSERGRRRRHLTNLALFLGFIALCIGASSVTIRVEMRWIYVSYAAALLFLCYIYGAVESCFGEKGSGWREAGEWLKNTLSERKLPAGFRGRPMLCALLILGYVALLIPVEGYYRGERRNLYYWSNQRRANTLAEITYGKYGKAFFDKEVYLLENSFGLDDYTLENFFRVYSRTKEPARPVIHVVESVEDFGLVSQDMVILAEDKKDNTYLDVTEFVKEEKLKLVKGCYEDGWLDKNSEFVVKTGKTGKLLLHFYYPGTLTGGERAVVRREGETVLRVDLNQPSQIYELEAEPFEKLRLTVECNFTLDSAPEKRGEEDLAVVLQMETP